MFPRSFQTCPKNILKTFQNVVKILPKWSKMAPRCPPVENLQKVHKKKPSVCSPWAPHGHLWGRFLGGFSMCFSEVFSGGIFKETFVTFGLHFEPLRDHVGDVLGYFFDVFSRCRKKCFRRGVGKTFWLPLIHANLSLTWAKRRFERRRAFLISWSF